LSKHLGHLSVALIMRVAAITYRVASFDAHTQASQTRRTSDVRLCEISSTKSCKRVYHSIHLHLAGNGSQKDRKLLRIRLMIHGLQLPGFTCTTLILQKFHVTETSPPTWLMTVLFMSYGKGGYNGGGIPTRILGTGESARKAWIMDTKSASYESPVSCIRCLLACM
jgi:hypothetical protein